MKRKGMLITRKSYGFFSLLLALLVGSATVTAEQSVQPGINDYYRNNPDYATWVQRFETKGREVFDRRHDIIKAMAIGPGMRIADIGAGTGLFTRLFSRVVGPRGKVYAVDISDEFVRNIVRLAQERSLKNIVGVVSTDKDVKLEADSIDLAFVCDTYHHFEYPQTMLSSIRKALTKDGRLVVIDYRKQRGISSGWVMGHVRTNQAITKQEISRAGFQHVKDFDFLTTNYFMVFKNTK